MKFKFSCQKCGSTTVYMDKDYRLSWENDMILKCYTCGWALYGAEQVQNAIEDQYAKFLALGEDPKVLYLEWEKDHKDKQAHRVESGLCANLECKENGGLPASARESSIYCSRKCCVHNAHMKEKERKVRFRSKASPKLAA